MKLYRTIEEGPVVFVNGTFFRSPIADWDALLKKDDLVSFLQKADLHPLSDDELVESDLLPPIQSQEVWGAGVTYSRSMQARMDESQDSGGAAFYDAIYYAERPELFFKTTSHRVVGSGQSVRIRKDSSWNVPEPELTLVISPGGTILGYTVGNDMGSRSIEGENPLYLPQAKIYNRCCALGPGILLAEKPLPKDTRIQIHITRDNEPVFEGKTAISQMRRAFDELVEYLFRDNSFPMGCFLMTGTGIIPEDEFTLQSGDVIEIAIDHVGVLKNRVE